MVSRRKFLRTTGAFGTAALAFRSGGGLEDVLAASAAVQNQSPADVAKDELYWGQIQQQFPLDRQLINLNSGNHCTQPNVVMDAVKRYLDMQNMAPVWYQGQMRGNMVASYVLASASDGYQALFAIAELDPAFTAEDILVADTVDGQPLFEYQGPFRLVAPKDLRGARSVRMLQRLDVVRLRK